MRAYSIEDLLIGQFYRPTSFVRRDNGGIINYATKRDNVWVGTDFETYSIRYNGDNWATVAVKVREI